MPETYNHDDIMSAVNEIKNSNIELSKNLKISQERANQRHESMKDNFSNLNHNVAQSRTEISVIGERVANVEGRLQFSADNPNSNSDRTEDRLFGMMEKQASQFRWMVGIFAIGTLVAIGFTAADISGLIGVNVP